jgi:hypothetical protein
MLDPSLTLFEMTLRELSSTMLLLNEPWWRWATNPKTRRRD